MILGICCGLITGIFSGLVGVGGGIVMIPLMTMLFGFSQHLAQGTSLAVMLPPIGILAVYTYYKQGFVDIPMTLFIICGFIIGGWLGAKWAVLIPAPLLKRFFGVTMVLIGLKFMILK
ncbi:permease [Candidatus Marinamargulisbacteria bacterium SCGC AG-414-C22]|nr:permease [Candidatus Marinamargulisbacteria bacterium SCGC AG-414-C22]